MKKYELNKINNSKKLIIGISILFCTIILIIGVTTAYFTQSDTKPIGNIVATDKVTLEYNDSDNSYMLGDLIPTSEEYAIRGYEREGENKCKDDNGYNVCSIYRFTISNTSDVTQKLVIDMKPVLNSFHNLKYNIYEINNGVSTNIKKNQPLTYDDKTPINLFNNLTLNNKSSKTYEIVYYILNNPNANQNLEDAGKKFGAQIIVNSVTTGEYVSKQIGESCYKVLELSDTNSDTTYYSETISPEYYGTHILTEFYGIDKTTGDVVEGCGVTEDDNGFYSVAVPSKIGDKEISTLGNTLFKSFDINTMSFNEFNKITNITVEEGIEIIEDGVLNTLSGTFIGNGVYLTEGGQESNFDSSIGLSEFNNDFTIKLPNTLKYIGALSFWVNNIKEIVIPPSVETIGFSSFGGEGMGNALKLSKVTFGLDQNGNSNLKTIRQAAFSNCNLTNEKDNNGDDIPLVIPKSVETIEDYVFSDNYLTKILFEVDVEGKSNLDTIGQAAFNGNNLTYTDPLKPLIIPSNVTVIDHNAFSSRNSNKQLNYIIFNGTLTEGNTDWYTSMENGGVTTLVP